MLVPKKSPAFWTESPTLDGPESTHVRDERSQAVLDRLPAGPFTESDFLAHAMGLNAIDNVSDIQPMLEFLAANNLIRSHDSRPDGPPSWMRCP